MADEAERRGGIRSGEADYGEREDLVAEEEDARQRRLGDGPGPGGPAYPPRSLAKPKSTINAMQAASIGLRRHKSKLRLAIAVVALWPLFWWILLGSLMPLSPALFPASLRRSNSTLLVVAHPDDECLFFSPSVLSVVKRAASTGSVLVLSSGDHYGLGEQRRTELKGSCEELGVSQDRCDVMNVPDIQDDPKKWWPVSEIIDIVSDHVARWSVDTIITFDSGGVSGHINHRAVSAAITQYALSPPPPPSPDGTVKPVPAVWVSETVAVPRKYSGLYDLPFSALPFLRRAFFHFSSSSTTLPPMDPPYNARTEIDKEGSEYRRRARGTGEKALLVADWSLYRAGRKAFWRHKSQMVWDRHLYMILSRYMYFNTLEKVV